MEWKFTSRRTILPRSFWKALGPSILHGAKVLLAFFWESGSWSCHPLGWWLRVRASKQSRWNLDNCGQQRGSCWRTCTKRAFGSSFIHSVDSHQVFWKLCHQGGFCIWSWGWNNRNWRTTYRHFGQPQWTGVCACFILSRGWLKSHRWQPYHPVDLITWRSMDLVGFEGQLRVRPCGETKRLDIDFFF